MYLVNIKDTLGLVQVVLEPAPQGMGAAKRSTGSQHTSRNPVKNAKFGHKTRKIINYSNIFAQMKKSQFLVWRMLEVIFSIFFRTPRLRAVPALRSSLLLYSKGFALLPFKNEVNRCSRGCGGQYQSPRRSQSSGVPLS